MSETGPDTEAVRRWSWWQILLIVSLALNLLIGAAAATRFFTHSHPERMTGMSYLQLVPRKFLSELPHARREELLGQLRDDRDRFKDGQQKSRKVAESLADALDASPYDEARVRSVLDEFTGNGVDQINLGAKAALDFISRLSTEERILLAQRIRERAKGGRKEKQTQ
jgi:uncharacterized membrane protein